MKTNLTNLLKALVESDDTAASVNPQDQLWLRTLDVQNSCYHGIYTGPQQQRDEAYHQGTVWSFLLGPFVESYLKVNGFSRKSKKKAAEYIQPLMKHLTEDGCLWSVSQTKRVLCSGMGSR